MSTAYTSFINMNGIIKGCGYNVYGQLGLNDKLSRDIFTDVPDISNVKQISCGGGHSMLLMKDGTIKTCGYNKYGQLGLNDKTHRTVFTDVPDISNVKHISSGDNHSVILMNDGSVKASGYNLEGQLGLDDKLSRSVFTDVIGLTDNMKLLIKKQNDDSDLYTVSIDNSSLVVASTSIDNMNFEKGFNDTGIICRDTEYGKPIDKLGTFSIYKSITKVDTSLFD